MNMSEAPNDQQASAGPGGDRIGYPFWLALACVVAIIHRLVRQAWTQYRWDVRLTADHDIRRRRPTTPLLQTAPQSARRTQPAPGGRRQ